MSWQPNEEELRKGAPHVAFEIRAFRSAWEHYQSNTFAYTAWFIHCRNLMGFFDGRGKDRDLFARHYIDGTAWDDALKGLVRPGKYDHWWDTVSRLAAHLTFHRVELETRDFVPDAAITKHLLGLALQFVQMLPPPRAAWFGDLLL
ncbi:MAG: hypothetical protein ACREOC_18135 [Gemmatimonadales bacterium]